MKDVIKDLRNLALASELEKAKKLLPEAYQAIDKAAHGGIISKNTASRRKALVAKLVAKRS